MPPAFLNYLVEPSLDDSDSNLGVIIARSFTSQIKGQWRNPSDILSLLLIIEPEIVQRALTQLSGHCITPVAFSFGWVAYSLRALLAVIGDGRLMSEADFPAIVIEAGSGHIRKNKSWIIGRLLRDLEARTKDLPATKNPESLNKWEALRISVFKVDDSIAAGVACYDWVWYMGFGTIFVQICISFIPWILYSDWTSFVVTVGGTLLALNHGSLSQWKKEKWNSTASWGGTVSITQGNGNRHAMVIVGKKGCGLDFEMLATGGEFSVPLLTILSISVLAILWGVLLITVVSMREHSWFLLAIGLIGMIQNGVVSGVSRSGSAQGIHLRKIDTITGQKVKDVLRKVEETYQFVGTSLIPVFFPGSMRVSEDEVPFWKEAMNKRVRPNKHGVRVDMIDLKDDKGTIKQDSTTPDQEIKVLFEEVVRTNDVALEESTDEVIPC